MYLMTTRATLVDMSEPQQPPVPSAAQPDPAVPVAPHLRAEPQYPAGTHALGATLSPEAPQAQSVATPAPTAYPTAAPLGYPAAAPGPQGYAPVVPGYPVPVAPSAQARGGNPLGRTAFVIAVATFVINLIVSLARPLVYGGIGGYDLMLAVDNGIGFLSFFGYAVALVLGLIAARRSAARLLTGIAIGIAGAGAVGLVFTGILMATYRFF